MAEQLPTWSNIGVEPPESLKNSGWDPGIKPAAQHMNWLFNRAYKCLEELQRSGMNITELEQTVTTLQQTVTTQGQSITDHLDDDVNHIRYAVATGTANTYAVTLNPAPITYVEGLAVSVKINVNASAASTINVNGMGAKGIKKANGSDVTNLKANGIYTMRYDGVNFILQGEGGSGNAIASDLLSGKTASTDAGDIVGTMPNRGTFNLALGANVPAGYYSGGSVPNGKKFATGSGVCSNTLLSFELYNGSQASSNSYYATVTGLTFLPSIVIIDCTQSRDKNTILFPEAIPTDSPTFRISSKGTNGRFILTGNAYVNGTGFRLPVTFGNSEPFRWYAIE